MDAYDLSATDSLYPFAGFEFDIGNGNLDGIPSLNSPFQVWDTSGDQTVTKAEASAILSRSNDTYQADTHVMTTFGFTAWDQETNDASFANGPDYQIGVGSLDYAAVDVGGSAGYTVDVANVGIVRGTVVSSQLQTGGTSGPARTFNLRFPLATLGRRQLRREGGHQRPHRRAGQLRPDGCGWTQGEFTGDGTVDINDLTIVLANYGGTLGSSPPAAVPEPSTLLLAAAGLLGAGYCAEAARK